MKRPILDTLAVALLVVASVSGCRDVPGMSVEAPARLQQALSVVDDLGCTAQLVSKDGERGDVIDLERSDDGIRFSGFVDAAPGRYTLELTFSGVAVSAPEGGRRFLGRLISDDVTVVEGDAASPAFSTALDTVGRDGDNGDEDEDGLGFLDELILGSSPDNDDSDNDGVVDGLDCRPANPVINTPIAEGGSVDDCDGDGFIGLSPIFADSGNDCVDTNSAINPAADDDCDTLQDEDCNPATCPVDDSVGPTIRIDAPAADTTAGCALRIAAAIEDPSNVQSAFATWVDDPFDSAQRVSTLTESTTTPGLWQSAPISAIAATGFRDGSHLLRVTAFDGTGNSSNEDVNFTLVVDAPTVTTTGPAVIEGGPADVSFNATSSDAIVRMVVFAAPPSVQFPNLFDIAEATQLVDVDVSAAGTTASHTISLDPADFTDRQMIYVVIEDAVGRLSSPAVNDFASVTAGAVGAARCDGNLSAKVPGIIVEPPTDPGDLFTWRGKLADATARARAIDADAQLAAVFGLGLDSGGTVDLGDASSFSKRWEIRFLKPNGHGITVRYLTPAFGSTEPQVEPDVEDPLDDEVLANAANTGALRDSDELAGLFGSTGCTTSYTGNDSDAFILTRNSDFDQAIIQTAEGDRMVLNASSLEVIAGCD